MKRIRLLDILRGFAIIGTLGTNIWVISHLGNYNIIFGHAELWFHSLESFVKTTFLFLINGKLLGMLTIMFGIGLAIKYNIARDKKLLWPGIYIWSMVLLFLDGILHYLFVVEFDILMSYALTGIIVALIIKTRDKIQKGIMWFCLAIHLLAVGVISLSILLEGQAILEVPLLQLTSIVYGSGSYLEQILFRLEHFWFFRTEALFILPMNIFLFMVGIRLYRAGAFSDDQEGRRIRKKMLKWGLGLGIPLNLLIYVPGGGFDFLIRYAFAPILAIGYMAIIAYLLERNYFTWLFKQFEYIGKMALSCYMLQNILASFIFYGWGLGFGLSPYLSAYTIILAWLIISIALIIFCRLWLSRFKAGPFEWIWRYLTDLPFKRAIQKT